MPKVVALRSGHLHSLSLSGRWALSLLSLMDTTPLEGRLPAFPQLWLVAEILAQFSQGPPSALNCGAMWSMDGLWRGRFRACLTWLPFACLHSIPGGRRSFLLVNCPLPQGPKHGDCGDRGHWGAGDHLPGFLRRARGGVSATLLPAQGFPEPL